MQNISYFIYSSTADLTRSENTKLKKIKYKGYVMLESQFLKTTLIGSFDHMKKTSNTKLTLDYSVPKQTKEKISVGLKLVNRSTESLMKYSMNG